MQRNLDSQVKCGPNTTFLVARKAFNHSAMFPLIPKEELTIENKPLKLVCIVCFNAAELRYYTIIWSTSRKRKAGLWVVKNDKGQGIL